jgi:hypothetical protein
MMAAGLIGVSATSAAAADTPRLPLAEQEIDPNQPWIVSLGDSYISGEGGMEASKGFPGDEPSTDWTVWNTATPDSNRYYSGFTYGDKENYSSQQAQEIIDYCHRSGFSAIANLAEDYNYKNFACSGATAVTGGKAPAYKPGVDFGTIGPVSGQAAELQEFAQDNDVQVVVLSIGGNDLGFADIAKACVTSYMLGIVGSPCSKGPVITAGDVSQAASPENLARVADRVEGAITNIVSAMRSASRPDGSWKLVFQSVPLPIASTEEMAFPDSGGSVLYARQNLGGCGIRDIDMDWIQDTVYPGLIGSMQKAVERSKPALRSTPVVFQDNSMAFAGHKLCEKGVAETNVNFPGGTSDPLADYPLVPWTDQVGKKSEWITPIIVADQLGSDIHRQTNALHPNYWGQRALSACLDIALNADENTVINCTQDASEELDSEGRPAMTLTGPATPITFTVAPAPEIVDITTTDGVTSMEFDTSNFANVEPVESYEYSLDNGETWVPAEGTASPLQINGLEVGEPYAIRLRALTSGGIGAPSEPYAYAIAPGPQAPTDVVAVAKDYSAEVSFTPGDTGGWWDYDRYEYRIVGCSDDNWCPGVGDWQTVPGGIASPLTIPNLGPEVDYEIEFRGVTFVAPSEAVNFEVTPGPRLPNFYNPVEPVRVYDSRDPAVSGENPTGAFTGSRTLDLSAVVPPEATAITYNATVTGASANGFLAVTPGGTGATDTSVVNFQAGETIPNAYVVQLGDDATIDLTINGGPAQVVIDLLGWYTLDVADSVYLPLADPVRAYDSRNPGASGPLVPGQSVDIDLAAELGGQLPEGADAVTFNLTSTGGQASGFLSIVPTGAAGSGPNSMVNWNSMSGTIANAGAVQVSETGTVTVTNDASSRGSTEFVLDITGVYGPLAVMGENASEFFPIVPDRAYDSRAAEGPINAGTSPRANVVTGIGEGYQQVPADATAVAVNTTVTGTTPTGVLAIVPGDVNIAQVSTLNWTLPTTITRANGSTVGVATMAEEGKVNAIVGGAGQTEYLLDLAGYFKTTPLSRPGAPTDVVAFPLDEGARLTFTPATDGGLQITRYDYCDLGSGDCSEGSANWQPLRGNQPPLSVIGLQNEVETTLVLRAVNGLGAGPASDPVSVTPWGLPGKPTDLVVTPANGAVQLTFTAPPGAGTLVNYEYSTDAGQTWRAVDPPSTDTSFEVNGVTDQDVEMTNGELYQFAVRGVNETGAGEASDVVESGPAGPPTAPTSPKKGAVFGDRFATVDFTPGTSAPVAPILKYQWRATSVPPGEAQPGEPVKDVWYDCGVLDGNQPDESPCKLEGLRNGYSYFISLRAVSAVGESTPSLSVFGIQAQTAPTVAISNLQARWGASAQAIELLWTNPTQPTGTALLRNYEYSTDGGVTWKLRNPAASGAGTSFNPWRITTTSDDQPLTPGQEYEMAIRAINDVGTGPTSNVVAITVPLPG